MTIKELIQNGEVIWKSLKYDEPPYNVIRTYHQYKLSDEGLYYDWKEMSIKFLHKYSPSDIERYKGYANEFEKHYVPKYILNMISVLRACDIFPTSKQEKENLDSEINEELNLVSKLEQQYEYSCTIGTDACNSRIAIDAFFSWYKASCVLFDKMFYNTDELLLNFNELDTSGNGYTLYSEYKRISSVYYRLVNRIKEGRYIKIRVKSPSEEINTYNNANDVNIFISYSHQDSKWVDRLKIHLKALSKVKNNIDYWVDTRIRVGSKWREEIQQAIERANVAILLISTDYLASDFIANNEIPPLLEKAEKNGCRIMPLIVSPCAFEMSQLSIYQAVNNPECSLSEQISEASVDRIYLELVRSIVNP